MKTVLQAIALAFFTTFGLGATADAATVRSVEIPFLNFGGIIYEIEQSGTYTLNFSGTGEIADFPDYLGFGGYVFAEMNGGLGELLVRLGTGDGVFDFSATSGASISLGFLAAGVDFAAGLLSAGNSTMSLVRIDDQPAPVPLPATLPLLAAAMGAAGLAARRRHG